ncbi:hypothetical protein BN2475_120185 [Paraburkholderia ribeironis]|uniref:Uncharacterized protein n=1 Tax=Paraburkholderia ribeironis TaxID=1247936 RepID=A0A1N7RRH3_9BURK|nr:hypothetical protein BN2475_120185 [Paraburkholderia ribeironis]
MLIRAPAAVIGRRCTLGEVVRVALFASSIAKTVSEAGHSRDKPHTSHIGWHAEKAQRATIWLHLGRCRRTYNFVPCRDVGCFVGRKNKNPVSP